jgi:hypothetical protein
MWLSCGLWFDVGDIVALCKVENRVIRNSMYLMYWGTGTDIVMWLSCDLWFDVGDIVPLCKVEIM